MSLSVDTFTRQIDGEMNLIEAAPGEDLAGFERCRHDLWGHASVRALGLLLLPTLAEGDIYAEDVTELAQLEMEVQQILADIAKIAAATGYDEEFIGYRCRNILKAIHRAQELGGGVVIW